MRHRLPGHRRRNLLALVAIATLASVLVPLAAVQATGPSDAEVPSPFLVDVGARAIVPSEDAAAAQAGGAFYVQFARPLRFKERARLSAAGVLFAQAIPPSTYLARLQPGAAEGIAADPLFLGLEPVTAIDRLTPALRSRDGAFSGVVRFFADVSVDDALAAAGDAGLTVPAVSGFLFNHRLVVVGDAAAATRLAASGLVVGISEAPPPPQTDNLTAQAISNVDDVQTTLGIDGAGVVMGIWDGGPVRATHQDLTPRVVVQEAANPVDNHATHVAGTMMASGSGNANAEGMAPAAGTMHSYDFDGDPPTEFAGAVSTHGVLISNNSWGSRLGWHSGIDWGFSGFFGLYSSSAATWDQVVVDTGLIIEKSAGNDRDDCNPVDATDCDGFQAGDGEFYDNMSHRGSAKNVITVGAIEDDGSTITGFSSAGPTDDGRIKPDVVANGAGVTSTCSGADNHYCSFSGTSQSGPVVSGTLALLMERHRDVFGGSDLAADTAKALLVNTAIDLGRAGPDYLYGHGLLDALAAANQVTTGTIGGGTVDQGDTFTESLDVASGSPLDVTINWIDPPGVANSAAADITNDLDLRLIAPDGTVFHPFTGPGIGNVTGLATAGSPNHIDTVEHVNVPGPIAGTWTVEVTGFSVPSGPQSFALVTSSNQVGPPPPSDDLADAHPFTQVSQRLLGTNVAATEEVDEPSRTTSPCGFITSTVWARFEPGANMTVVLNTLGSDFDTVLAAYTGPSVDNLTLVKCNDDASGLLSKIVFPATAGTTYWIQVGGYNGATGDIKLNILTTTTFFCDGSPATRLGTANDDILVGGAGSDVFVSFGGNDTLRGKNGDDKLCAGAGDDVLHGGLGNDRLLGGSGDDTATYVVAPAGVTVDVASGTATGGDGSDTLVGINNVVGSAHDDVLRGNAQGQTLDGRVGNDRLLGRSGADLLLGGSGDDLLMGQGGDDEIRGHSGTDTISYFLALLPVNVDLGAKSATGDGSDYIIGVENVLGSANDDVIKGNGLGNRLLGVGGDDELWGRNGNDTLTGGPGFDRTFGGPGADTCSGEIQVSC